MADPYHSVKTGRLTFKGGSVATLSKPINKNKKKSKKLKQKAAFSDQIQEQEEDNVNEEVVKEVENVYTIDAAKKMSYQELFPVEAKKFRYVPNDVKAKDKAKAKIESTSVEEALDDRVKKKADRYCK